MNIKDVELLILKEELSFWFHYKTIKEGSHDGALESLFISSSYFYFIC